MIWSEGATWLKTNWEFVKEGGYHFMSICRSSTASCSHIIPNPPTLQICTHFYNSSTNLWLPWDLMFREDSLQELMQRGDAVFLLDGLDTIPITSGRSEIGRLFYEIAETYPNSRCVITSRVASYSVEAPVAIPFDTVKLRAFDQGDIERFLTNWNLLIAVSQMGAGARSKSYADKQTVELLSILNANERIRTMASNPMLLTMMAITVETGRSLPKKVSDLYRSMVDLLLDPSSSRQRGITN